MNEIIKKLPVFESADAIKAKDEQTKLEHIESMEVAAEEIKAMLANIGK